MHDEQNNQSVKDILEDIKKAISGKNTDDSRVKVDDHEEDDILHLKEEYSQDEDSDEENVDDNKDQPDNYLHSDDTLSRVELQNDDHLILKENIEEIKVLLGKMQNELQQQQQPRPSLTVEELVMSLLKPELSEWLNKHLYKLVKAVVEKELKDIINNNK